MKNIVIVMAAAAIAAVVAVVLMKALGYEAPPWLGGAVGGAIAGLFSVKLAEKNSAE